MPEIPALPQAQVGERILTQYNDSVDLLNRLAGSYANNYGQLLPGGEPRICEQFLAKVTDDPSFSDARYTCTRFAIAAKKDNDQLDGKPDPVPSPETQFTAINLDELPRGTHSIPADTLVNVFAIYAVGKEPVKRYFFNYAPPPLHYGLIQSVGNCNAYCAVKECDNLGNILGDPDTAPLITVFPTKGGCDLAENGFCLNIGDVIAYLPSPGDPTGGIQVGAYKSVSLQYTCTTSNSANVPGLSEIHLYPGDFTLVPDTTCGDGGATNVGKIYWNGNIVTDTYAGATYDHVKVWKFDSPSTPPSGTPGVDYSDLAWVISSGTTNANFPTIGGAPCNDESHPNFIKVTARAKVGTAITSIDSITCNLDGTITATYTTARVLIPI